MNTVSRMIEQAEEFEGRMEDFKIAPKALRFSPSGEVSYMFDELATGLTNWSLSQICARLKYPPVKYMQKCPPELLSQNLNHWLSRTKAPKWLVRVYDNGGEKEVRAILTHLYKPISNSEVLKTVQELLVDVPYKLVRPFISPDVLHAKITIADSQGGNFAIGAYVGNGNIGNRSLRVTPFIQRHSCTNSIIMRKNAYTQRHVGASTAFMKGAIKEKVGQALRMAPEFIEKVVEAEAHEIPDIGKVLADLCKKNGFSKVVTDNALVGTEGARSRMGVVNGLSFAAHATSDINQEQRIDLETLAGDVLADQFFNQSKRQRVLI